MKRGSRIADRGSRIAGRRSEIAFSLLCAVLTACAPQDNAPVQLGAPLAELQAEELARFRAGEVLFNRVFRPEDGLGPLFNENQCSACHTSPATGGTGDGRAIKATRFTPPDRCDALTAQGGENVRAQVTPALRAHGIVNQPAPPEATEHARFNVPFLFGLGLIENIPESEILRRADPDDNNDDGISGRPGYDARGRLARFGRKAEIATLPDFVDTALRLEMGLTTPQHAQETQPTTVSFPVGVDRAADPEISIDQLDRLADFVRFLAPPARRVQDSEAEQQQVERGEMLFLRVGCASCHVPALETGRSTSAALNNKRVGLYSDLLLHDLGDELRTTCGIIATPNEIRTEPLMGLGRRNTYLHDGRAHDLTQAILLHGGEATRVRERFRGLTELQQNDLIQFLRTL